MWWIWLLVALIAAIIEIAGSGLVFGGIAGAALVAAVVSAFLSSSVGAFFLAAVIFALTTILYLFALRPMVLRMVTGQSHSQTTDGIPKALIGRPAMAIQEITPFGGQIQIGQSGEYWSAKSYDGKDVIPAGAHVEILMVDGLTALVGRHP